jgi:hypothetical protein
MWRGTVQRLKGVLRLPSAWGKPVEPPTLGKLPPCLPPRCIGLRLMPMRVIDASAPLPFVSFTGEEGGKAPPKWVVYSDRSVGGKSEAGFGVAEDAEEVSRTPIEW